MLAEHLHERGGEDHLALGGGGLQLLRGAPAGELLADTEQARVEVDVAPAEPERLADAEPRVGEELEEDAGLAWSTRLPSSRSPRMRTSVRLPENGFSPGSRLDSEVGRRLGVPAPSAEEAGLRAPEHRAPVRAAGRHSHLVLIE